MRQRHPMHLTRLATAAVLAGGLSLPALAQSNDMKTPSSTQAHGQVSAAEAATYRGLRASEMIGMSVRNLQGDNIGQIGDLVVDMNNGKVRYAILRFDPGVLQGEKLFAVPTTELRIAADRNDVVYDMDESRLERAAIERSEWDADLLDDPAYLARMDQAWGIAQPSRGAMAHRASDLIGKDVNSRSGDRIGEVEELVVNMAKQQVHYAVLQFDPGWATPEQNYAFPLSAFELTSGRDELMLDIGKGKLQAMKSFPDSRYANLNDRVWVADIDRYFVTVLPAAGGSSASAGTAGARATPATLFSRLDEDRNGSLSKAEAKDAADVDRDWARFDDNGDQRISRDEFVSQYSVEPGR